MDLAGRFPATWETIVVISFFFFFFLSFTEKKSGTFSGIKRTDTKRKTKRKRKFFDAIFISLAAITGIIPGFWDEQTYSCRKEETDIDLLR